MKWYEKIVNWLKRNYTFNKILYKNLLIYFEDIDKLIENIKKDYNNIKNKNYWLDIFLKKNHNRIVNFFRIILFIPIFSVFKRFIVYCFTVFVILYRRSINLFFDLTIEYMPIHAKKYGVLYKKKVIFDLNKARKAFLYLKFSKDLKKVLKNRDIKLMGVIQREFYIFRIIRIFFSVIYLIIKEMPVFFGFLSFFFRFFYRLFRTYLKYYIVYLYRHILGLIIMRIYNERLKSLGIRKFFNRAIYLDFWFYKFCFKFFVFKLRKFEAKVYMFVRLSFRKLYKSLSFINWIKSIFRSVYFRRIKELLKLNLPRTGRFFKWIPIIRKSLLKRRNFNFINNELSKFIDKNENKFWINEIKEINYFKIISYKFKRDYLLLKLKYYEILHDCYYILLLPEKYKDMPYQIILSIIYLIKLIIKYIAIFFYIIYRMIFKLK